MMLEWNEQGNEASRSLTKGIVIFQSHVPVECFRCSRLAAIDLGSGLKDERHAVLDHLLEECTVEW
jgi:hypothetical protein